METEPLLATGQIPEATFKQRWNEPRINIFRLAVVCFAFLNLGANDASYGALLPSLSKFYNLSTQSISLIFLSPVAGYVVAALSSDAVHNAVGQRGVAIAGSFLRCVAYLALTLHGPYPLILATLPLLGMGNGFLVAGWNAWVGNLNEANEVLGFLHGFYGLGAMISPLVATSMVVTWRLQWWVFFLLMLGLAVVELIVGATAFWTETAERYRARHLAEHPAEVYADGERSNAVFKHRTTWLISFFLIVYAGSEVSLGGWIPTFMLRERHSDPFFAGLCATLYWLGLTAGRVVLGFITPRVGERNAITMYLVAGIGAQLVFWLVPVEAAGAVAVSFLGFFLGPMFPAAVVAITKLMPPRLHVRAIGFVSAVGSSGSALLPFAVGAMAQRLGVSVLQPFIMVLLALQITTWLLLPNDWITKAELDSTETENGHRE